MLKTIIMWLCHLEYKKQAKKFKPWNMTTLYIMGTEKHYPRYLLYTEDADTYSKMDKFI